MRATLAQARSLMAVGRHSEAVVVLQRAVAEQPEAWYPRCLLAACLIGAKRPEEAAAMAGSAIALNPEGEWPHRVRSVALGLRGKWREALLEGQRAVQFGPNVADAWFTLADAQLHTRWVREAADSANRGLALAPRNVRGHDILGRIALRHRRWKEAEERFRHALEIDPTEWALMNNLGVALRAQRRHPEAIAAFEAAARLNPRVELARRNLFSNTRLYLNSAVFTILMSIALLVFVQGKIDDPRRDAVLLAVLLLAAAGLYWQRRRRKARLGTVTRTFYEIELRKERMRSTIQVVTVLIPITLAVVIAVLLNSVVLMFVFLFGGAALWALGVRFFWKSHVLPWLAQRGF